MIATLKYFRSPALWLFAVALMCGAGSAAEQSQMGLITVAPDERSFVEQGMERPYIPFGTNYYDPNTGWAPKLWRQFDAGRVREHFRVMSEMGVNCARVFLTAGSFQPTAETINEEALAKLDKMVEIARQTNVRLILTGPDHWEGQPDYWRPDRFAGEKALAALDRFWEVVGRRYRDEPAIFAWDLLNEPHIPWVIEEWRPKWQAWLHGTYANRAALASAWGDELTDADRWENVAVPQDRPDTGNPRLRDWQRFREHLADEWVRRQVEAIRRADPTHLISVGYIQWSYPLVRSGNPGRYAAFNPQRQVRWLDFITIHFYPTQGSPFQSQQNWRENISYLQAVVAYCHAGKPVVLGEYGWYGGGAPQKHPYLSEEQQAQWIGEEIEATRSLADGWLSWPFADTPSSGDISLYAGLVKPDLTLKAWGRKFETVAANLSELKKPAIKVPPLVFAEALTADEARLKQEHQSYTKAIHEAIDGR
jgi:hypothetical protein